MLKGIRYGLGLTTVGLLVLLALQNLGTTEVRLLLWKVTLPLFAVILVSVVTGAVIGALWMLPYRSAVRQGGAAPPPIGARDGLTSGRHASGSGTGGHRGL